MLSYQIPGLADSQVLRKSGLPSLRTLSQISQWPNIGSTELMIVLVIVFSIRNPTSKAFDVALSKASSI